MFISDWDSVVLSPFGDGFDHGRGVLDLRGVVRGLAMIGGQQMEVVWEREVGHGGSNVAMGVRDV